MNNHTVKDIVCGMQVNEAKVSAKTHYQGKEYHFCSLICKRKFDSNPDKYIERENNNGRLCRKKWLKKRFAAWK